jgi:hypothetical protein
MRKQIIVNVKDKIDKVYFKQNFIVDLDLRASGMSDDKKSFMFPEAEFGELPAVLTDIRISPSNCAKAIPLNPKREVIKTRNRNKHRFRLEFILG